MIIYDKVMGVHGFLMPEGISLYVSYPQSFFHEVKCSLFIRLKLLIRNKVQTLFLCIYST